eukprot:scaffold8023_cov103-Isochrysis_galbana.AAC.6
MCIISYCLGHTYAAFPSRLLPAVGAGTTGAALGALPPWCTLLYARFKHCLPTAYKGVFAALTTHAKSRSFGQWTGRAPAVRCAGSGRAPGYRAGT